MSSVDMYSNRELVSRAVRGARAADGLPAPRWVAIMNVFSLGSTFAAELCNMYGLDPNEVVGTAKEEDE